MNWQLIEAPTNHPNIKCATDRTNQNELALASIDLVKSCADWLIEQGFTVLCAEIGRRKPRIEIQACNRCGLLKGAVFVHERSAEGVRRGWVAIRFECEVRWNERGAA